MIYIGCTIQQLEDRFKEHERPYKKGVNKQCTSCQLFATNEEVKMELIEDCYCANQEQLENRESEVIQEYKQYTDRVCVNKTIKN